MTFTSALPSDNSCCEHLGVTAVAWDRDDTRLATVAADNGDKFIALWDTQAGVSLGHVHGHEKPPAAITFLPGSRLASGGPDKVGSGLKSHVTLGFLLLFLLLFSFGFSCCMFLSPSSSSFFSPSLLVHCLPPNLPLMKKSLCCSSFCSTSCRTKDLSTAGWTS